MKNWADSMAHDNAEKKQPFSYLPPPAFLAPIPASFFDSHLTLTKNIQKEEYY